MDGIPALDLWKLVTEAFRSSQNQLNKTKGLSVQGNLNQTDVPTTHDSSELIHVYSVLSKVNFSHSIAMLYVLEDNGAVIKMIIQGRSPTKRHVSRTNRVSLDWWFDRINVNPKIQIMCIDTKHQIEDLLTKGHFTRDECNNLRHLFTFSHFISLLRS